MNERKLLPAPDKEELHRRSLEKYPHLADGEDLAGSARSGYGHFIREVEKKGEGCEPSGDG